VNGLAIASLTSLLYESGRWYHQANSKRNSSAGGQADAAITRATTTNNVPGKPITGEAAIAHYPTTYPIATISAVDSLTDTVFTEIKTKPTQVSSRSSISGAPSTS